MARCACAGRTNAPRSWAIRNAWRRLADSGSRSITTSRDAHDASEQRQHRRRLGVGQVVQHARHDGLVEGLATIQVGERPHLEAAARVAEAAAREGDVVRIEVDPDVLARHHRREAPGAAPEVEHALGGRGRQRGAHLADGARPVAEQPGVVKHGAAQRRTERGGVCPAQGRTATRNICLPKTRWSGGQRR